MEASLEEVKLMSDRENLVAEPVGSVRGPWRTVSEGEKGYSKIGGNNSYKARRGIETDPYGVYLVDVLEVLSGGDLIIRNLPELGKKDIQQVKERIENGIVFPALRGRDIGRWGVRPEIYVLFPVDAMEKRPYSERTMKERWPRTYSYFTRFRKDIEARKSKAARMLAERSAFYVMLGYGPYTVGNFKVVWKRMSNDIFAAVVSHHKTPFGYKVPIPLGTTAFFSTETEEEAHYLCGILNSVAVRKYIKSYSSAGRGFGAPSVMENVGIPNFEKSNALHKQLSKLSKVLHRLREEEKGEDIKCEEEKIEEAVRGLFGLREMR